MTRRFPHMFVAPYVHAFAQDGPLPEVSFMLILGWPMQAQNWAHIWDLEILTK